MKFLLYFMAILIYAQNINFQTYSKNKSYCDNNKWKYCSEYNITYLEFNQTNLKQIVKNLYSHTFKEFYNQNPQKDIQEILEYQEDRDVNMFNDTNISLFTLTKNTITLKKEIISYSGGAHGMDEVYFYNYNLKTKKLITLKQLFDIKKLTKIAKQYYKNLKHIKNLKDDGWFENKFVLSQEFAITKKGILFYYNSYEIKPYSFGHPKFILPYNQIPKTVYKE